MKELKPCPFCGAPGAAIVFHDGTCSVGCSNKDCIASLNKISPIRIRKMCTQMDSGQRKKGIDASKEWDMANSMVVVGAMQLYLSGKLEEIEVDICI